MNIKPKMTQQPIKSANSEFYYSDKFYYDTLDQWCQNVHKILSKSKNWPYLPLKPGAFGYDNLIMSLGHMFQEMNKENEQYADHMEDAPSISSTKMAKWIHEGWVKNYIYWRDHKPWLKSHPGEYNRPNKALGDIKRENLANTPFNDLKHYHKKKGYIISKYILKEINQR